VVSPQIALMRDQVAPLAAAGVAAAVSIRPMTRRECARARLLHRRELRLLYVARNGWARPDMVEMLAESHVR